MIRDELEPELRTPDIVLAGTDEVWMLSPVSLIRDVSERYGGVTPERLFEYPSGPRTPTSVQIRDSDRNGLDDVILSFKTGISQSNEIYRSIVYAYADFGADAAAVTALRELCAISPRDAACAIYRGPDDVDDLRLEERILSEASSSPDADNGDGTIKMLVEDVDLDGYYGIVYATEFARRASPWRARSTWPTSPQAPRP